MVPSASALFSTRGGRVQRAGTRKRRRGRVDEPAPCRALLDSPHGVGLAAAVASCGGLELHAVALLQTPEPVHLDRAVVDEDVRPAVGGDEAETLLRVEPLDRALSHGTSMLQ